MAPLRRSRVGLALTLSVLALPASASEPLSVRNLSPFASLRALPAQRSAAVSDGLAVDAHLAFASHFVAQSSADEALFLDGETTRFELTTRYGFAEHWDISLMLPWVRQDGGFLDPIINGWHDFFGMSDGGRSGLPEDELRYRWQAPGVDVDHVAGTSGLGDLQLAVNRVLWVGEREQVALGAGYQFATGDANDFTGSGAGDGWVVLRFSGRQYSSLPLSWHGQVGYTRAGDTELLGPNQTRNLWFAGLAVDWALSPRWSLLAQYDGHSGLADSSLEALGDSAAMLSFGARWAATPRWGIELSFVEDIVVESAPDIIFQATVRYRPTGS